MKKLIVVLVSLMLFYGETLLACPIASNFTVSPKSIIVGADATFSATITPREGQTLVEWTLTIEGIPPKKGTGGSVSYTTKFSTPGYKLATLSGTWTDKNGPHSGYDENTTLFFNVFVKLAKGPTPAASYLYSGDVLSGFNFVTYDATLKGISGITVTFITDKGSVSPTSAVSDSVGAVSIGLTTTVNGAYTVSASSTNSNDKPSISVTAGTGSINYTINQGALPDPSWGTGGTAYFVRNTISNWSSFETVGNPTSKIITGSEGSVAPSSNFKMFAQWIMNGGYPRASTADYANIVVGGIGNVSVTFN